MEVVGVVLGSTVGCSTYAGTGTERRAVVMRADNGVGGGCGTSSEPELSDSLKTSGAVRKALRDEAQLTQDQFAPLVQYSTAYIAKIEQGKRFPPRDLRGAL